MSSDDDATSNQVEETVNSVAGETTGGLSVEKKPKNTRHTLAITYVVGFLVIISAVLILSFFKGFRTDDVKDLLLTVSGVLSGPLGFIIGYYFKSKDL